MHSGEKVNTAALLMAYGSPTRTEDVMEYLAGIYEGKPVPQYAIDENTKKYRMFDGKSPSNLIVESIARKLSGELERVGKFQVFLGNKHWKPSLEEAVKEMSRDPPERIIAIPLFPFPSMNVEASYRVPLQESLTAHGVSSDLILVNGLHLEPSFMRSWEEVLSNYVSDQEDDTFFIFSAHSLPTMKSHEEAYKDSFFETAKSLASSLKMKHFGAGFQSRGKYGSSWLEPSVDDIFNQNKDDVDESVAAIPLGFIYDHLEILYDLDYEFGGRVRDSGKVYSRSPLPNDSQSFVECLRDTVLNALSTSN